jgi:uncharacterized protein YbjT (DUF2867 family)
MTIIKKTALIVGASGLVGNELVRILLEANDYEKIKIFTRNRLTLEHPKLEQMVVDFDQLDQYKEYLNVNDIFCCLGTTIKKAGTQESFKRVDYEYPLEVARLARDCGIDKFLIITAMGANINSKIFYNRVKGEVEEELTKIKFPSLIILRPSLLLGNRKEFRLGERIASVLSPLYSFALTGSLRKYKPIQAKDVAMAMYVSAQRKNLGKRIIQSVEIHDLSKA